MERIRALVEEMMHADSHAPVEILPNGEVRTAAGTAGISSKAAALIPLNDVPASGGTGLIIEQPAPEGEINGISTETDSAGPETA